MTRLIRFGWNGLKHPRASSEPLVWWPHARAPVPTTMMEACTKGSTDDDSFKSLALFAFEAQVSEFARTLQLSGVAECTIVLCGLLYGLR